MISDESPRAVIAGAGVLALGLALLIEGVLPAMLPESRRETVTRAVRTSLGETKWVEAAALPYTPAESRGRAVYRREGCWYCHSQYVRPLRDEQRRWGPAVEAGEFAFGRPHLWGTQRGEPDLSRIGLEVANGWHYAHFFDPRLVVPDSNMPAFRWLFRAPVVVEPAPGPGGLALPDTPAVRALGLDPAAAEPIYLTPRRDGLTFVPVVDAVRGEVGDRRGRRPELVFGNDRELPAGTRLALVAPTEELAALVAYVQKLGTQRGRWRDTFASHLVDPDGASRQVPLRTSDPAQGAASFRRRCAGCHGEAGDGRGPAATFLGAQPRDLTVGLAGTPMPAYAESIPDERDRLALAAYVLSLSAYRDPLYGTPEAIADEVKRALDDPAARYDTPETAYRGPGTAGPARPAFGMP